MSQTDIFFPVNLKLANKSCLVVGGKEKALGHIRSLLESGAFVKVITPHALEEIQTLARMNLLTWEKTFSSNALKNIFLVIVARDNKSLNKKIHELCNKRNILMLCDSDERLSSFTKPAIVRRGNLILTVSTGSQSLKLTSAIQKELETRYGREYARFLKFIRDIKGELPNKILSTQIQKELYRKLVKPELYNQIARRNLKKFFEEIKKILNA